MNEKVSLDQKIREIYREHYRDVYHFLIYFTGDHNEAEDLTQDVFIQVLKSLPNFNQQSQIKTWILSIAKHIAIDKYRKKKILSLFDLRTVHKIPTQDGIPEKEWETKEEQKELHDALQKLKPNYRIVVILRGLKEMSIRETADILDFSDEKVKVNYHRGLKMLKEQLSCSWEGGMLNGQIK